MYSIINYNMPDGASIKSLLAIDHYFTNMFKTVDENTNSHN